MNKLEKDSYILHPAVDKYDNYEPQNEEAGKWVRAHPPQIKKNMASFDGGCKTFITLTAGEIKDFNIITKTSIYNTQVECYKDHQSIILKQNTQYFVYSVSHEAILNFNNTTIELSCGYLLAISKTNKEEVILKGRNLIVIRLLDL